MKLGVSTLRGRVFAAAAIVAAFALSVVVSGVLTRETQGVAALWTANAFLVYGLLILPRAWGIATAVACAAAGIGVYLALGAAPPNPFVLTAINMAEAVGAAVVTRRVCGASLRVDDLKRLGKLLAFAVVPPCAVAAALAATYLAVADSRPWLLVWRDWAAADAAGLGVVLPALLTLRRRVAPEFRRSPIETAILYALVAVATWAVFGQQGIPLPFLVYGVLTLVAFRLGPRGAVAGALIVGVMAMPLTLSGRSVLQVFDPQDPAHLIRMTQLYLLAAFYAALATAMAVSGQARMKRLFLQRMEVARRSRARALAASAAKTDFLATMSHEIRTPLNSIIGFSRLLLDTESLPAPVRRQLGLIDSASASLLTVVNDILDFSKVEAGEVSLNLRPVSVQAMVEDTLAIAANSAAAKGLELTAAFEGAAGRLHLADDMRIRQVILNLVNNAVKFTASGSVKLTVEVIDGDHVDTVRFAVTDTGIGIPLDQRDRLFARFSQVDSSVARNHGGTGLGLAICKGLVELMDGEIGVRSEPGRGSTFWFEAPLSRADGAEVEAPSAVSADVGGARVLLVDDHPMNRELGAALLAIMGCEVHLAENGLQAVESARTGGFDIVLMDVHMPQMDGLAATRAIRGLSGHAGQVPIIAMTADVLPEHIERCRRAGMVDHVAKPVRPEALHAALSRWLERPRPAEARLTA